MGRPSLDDTVAVGLALPLVSADVLVDCKEAVDVGELDTACEEDEDLASEELEPAAGADVELTTSDVGSAGYICASRIITSAGRSWYH